MNTPNHEDIEIAKEVLNSVLKSQFQQELSSDFYF